VFVLINDPRDFILLCIGVRIGANCLRALLVGAFPNAAS